MRSALRFARLLLSLRSPASSGECKGVAFALFLVLVFLAPSLVLAMAVPVQDSSTQVAKRYCPDPPKGFFKGSIYHTDDGKPWIEVAVDPDFEAEKAKERNLPEHLPLTPIYNLVVRIKPEFNYYCIPGWAEGQPVTAEKLPSDIPIEGFVTRQGDLSWRDDVTVAGPGSFSLTSEHDDQNRFIYEWWVPGWPYGIAEGVSMVRFLETIAEGKPVYAALEVSKPDGKVEKLKSAISFSLCAPLWGKGRFQIVGKSDRGAFSNLAAFLTRFESDRSEGFAEIEPYASRQHKFSYVASLQSYLEVIPHSLFRDNDLRLLPEFRTPAQLDRILNAIKDKSACGGMVSLLYLDTLPGSVGITYLGAPGVLVSAEYDNPDVAVHEFSHAVAKLSDEYTLQEQGNFIPSRNCSLVPSFEYEYKGRQYGADKIEGCTFKKVGNIPLYRPSRMSIMNITGRSSAFNIISCGHILSALGEGLPDSLWPQCATMKGIIGLDGKILSSAPLAPFGNALSRLIHLFSAGGSLSAQTKTAVALSVPVASEKDPPYLIIESFDPENPWGEIVEIVPDDDGDVQKLPVAVEPPDYSSPKQEQGGQKQSLWQKVVGIFTKDKEEPLESDTSFKPATSEPEERFSALSSQSTQEVSSGAETAKGMPVAKGVRATYKSGLELAPLPEGTMLYSPLECLPTDGRYDYSERLQKLVDKANIRMYALIVEQRIAALEQGIALMDRQISLLERSLARMETLKSLDGVTGYLLPIGTLKSISFEGARFYGFCFKVPGAKHYQGPDAVGDANPTFDSISIFRETAPSTIEKIIREDMPRIVKAFIANEQNQRLSKKEKKKNEAALFNEFLEPFQYFMLIDATVAATVMPREFGARGTRLAGTPSISLAKSNEDCKFSTPFAITVHAVSVSHTTNKCIPQPMAFKVLRSTFEGKKKLLELNRADFAMQLDVVRKALAGFQQRNAQFFGD